jgi:hypothetical protein
MPRLGDLFAPRDRAYFELFEEAGRNATLAAELLEGLLENFPDSRELAGEILQCEHEGDRITHDIIDRLNHTFVTPIDREDILALASALDDIVDYTEEVADYLGLYRIEAPVRKSARQSRYCGASSRRSPSTPSRSTGSRTRAIGSPAKPSPRCSTRASTRWWSSGGRTSSSASRRPSTRPSTWPTSSTGSSLRTRSSACLTIGTALELL